MKYYLINHNKTFKDEISWRTNITEDESAKMETRRKAGGTNATFLSTKLRGTKHVLANTSVITKTERFYARKLNLVSKCILSIININIFTFILTFMAFLSIVRNWRGSSPSFWRTILKSHWGAKHLTSQNCFVTRSLGQIFEKDC